MAFYVDVLVHLDVLALIHFGVVLWWFSAVCNSVQHALVYCVFWKFFLIIGFCCTWLKTPLHISSYAGCMFYAVSTIKFAVGLCQEDRSDSSVNISRCSGASHRNWRSPIQWEWLGYTVEKHQVVCPQLF